MPTSQWSVTNQFALKIEAFRPLAMTVQVMALDEQQLDDFSFGDLLEPEEQEPRPRFHFSAPYEAGSGYNAYLTLFSQAIGETDVKVGRGPVMQATEEFVSLPVPRFGSPPLDWLPLIELLQDPETRTVVIVAAAGSSAGVLTVGAMKAVFTRIGRPVLDAIGNNLGEAVNEYFAYKREGWAEKRRIPAPTPQVLEPRDIELILNQLRSTRRDSSGRELES